MSHSILVVEDDPGLGRLIRKKMIQKGFSVLLAKNGDMAFRQQMVRNSDLIILDCYLPDMDGFNFVRKMREYEQHVPFIIMTGSSDIKKAVDFMKKGAVDYIIKDNNFWDKLPDSVEMAFKKLSMKENIANLGGKALSIQENMYLIEHSPDPVMIVEDNIIVFAHREAADILDQHNLEGMIFSELIHPYDRYLFITPIDHELKSDDFFEVRFLKNDGKSIAWLHLSRVNVEWENKSASLYYIRDCTPFKEVENALKTTERRLTFAMEAGCDGLWDWSKDDDEIYLSPRFQEIFDIQSDSLPVTFQEWLELVHPQDRQFVKQRLSDNNITSDDIIEFEFRSQKGTESCLYIFCRARAVEFSDNTPCRIIGSLIDISRWKS